MNKTHSFSTKNETDLDFVQGVKKEAQLQGISFSFIVIKALRHYEESKQNDGRKD